MAKARRAPVGVALMARDAEKTLGRCLDSLRPYVSQIVVGVDEQTTDKTANVAKKHGADIVFDLKVSDWHECDDHGKVLAQHFGNARNETFKRLDPALPFWMWIDSDDYLQGGELLAQVCAEIPPQCVGAWCPYHYATVNGGQATTTLFDRERILRSAVGWEWEHRVHETVKPVVPGPWWRETRVAVFHQEGVHKTVHSTDRNQLLLEIDLEDRGEDPRTTFYLANGHYAAGRLAEAAHWWERTTEIGQNPYENWQSYCYMSQAYRRLGMLDDATRAAFCAIDLIPTLKHAYFELAHVYLAAGQYEKVLHWDAVARTKEDPPPFVFVNPVDETYNARMAVADALEQMYRIKEARAVLEEAHEAIPNEHLAQRIKRHKELEAAQEQANAFVQMAKGKPDPEIVSLWESLKLPEDVRAFGRARDVYAPAVLRQRKGGPRIVFWCGRSVEPWGPPKLNETGIGGSETAVVHVADRFARDGWRVDVFNGAGKYEGVHGGVGYWEAARLGPNERADVLVSWRQPAAIDLPIAATTKVLWLHDHDAGPQAREQLLRWDRVLGVSGYHRDFLADAYDLPQGLADYVPNGIDLARFSQPVKKVPQRCVYASSPDRGLLALLKLWPRIVGDEQRPELHVGYGFDNIDKWINAGRHDLAEFKGECQRLISETKGVVYRGRMPQDELARLYQESTCWLYPTDFLETSCISAMEAMAGGCIPVTSSVGALKETVGNGGLVVYGPGNTRSNPYSPAWQDFYVKCAQGVLFESNTRLTLAAMARERAKAFSWDASYQRWKKIVGRLLGEREEVAA